MKKLIALAFITFCFHVGFTQTWTGPASVVTGQVANYTFTNTIFYSTYSWSATDGYVTAQSENGTTYSCTVTWTTVGTGSVIFTGGGAQRGTLSVLVSCPLLAVPNAAFSYPSGTSVCASGSITYTGAPPVGVTWYWQTSSTGTSTANSSASLTVTTSGTYYLRANCQSTWGDAEAASAITVNPIPTVSGTGNATCSGIGSGIVLTNNVPGTTNTWTFTSSNVSGASNGSGLSSTSSPYTYDLNQLLSNSSLVTGTATYTITPSANGCTGSSIQATATVYPVANISFSPLTQNICSGTNANISLSTNGASGMTYQWSVTQNPGTGASAPSSSTTAISQPLTNTTYLPTLVTYSIISYSNGCFGNELNIMFNVNPNPTITLYNVSPTICSNSTTNISFTSVVSGATFTWATSPTNVVGASNQPTPVSPGTISQPLSSQNGYGSGNVGYNLQSSATYANGGTCTSSNSTTVAVNPAPSASFPGLTICSGANAPINLTTNNLSGATYTWTVTPTNVSVVGLTPPSNATSTNPTLTATSTVPGTVNYSIVPATTSCTGSTLNFAVNVNPLPTIILNNLSPTICSGASTNISFSSPISVATFAWAVPPPTNAAGASPQATGVPAGAISQALSSHDGVTPGYATYNVASSATFANGGTCTSSGSTSVTVNPKPAATPIIKTLFVGTAVSVPLASNISSSTFSYTNTTNTNISGSSSGSGTPITQPMALVDGNNFGTATYSVTPTAYGCIGTPANTVIGIYPQPTVTSSSPSVYMGSTSTLSAQSFYDTYNWSGSTGAIAGGASISVTKPDTYTLTVVKNGVTSTSSASINIVGQFSGKNLNYFISNSMQLATSDTARIKLLTVDSVSQTVQYFDGHGRKIQNVVTQGSPQRGDIIQPIAYDSYGRPAVEYLPYSASQKNGTYVPTAISDQNQFYQSAQQIATDSQPFAVKVYESSSLNRIAKQGAPGVTWQPDNNLNSTTDHTVKHHYECNGPTDVLLFTYDPTTGYIATGPSSQLQYYGASQLQASRTTDEHQNDVIAYVDKLGHTVCKKVQYKLDSQGNKIFASTYYLYDNFENLVLVLPPEAVAEILDTQN